MSFSDDVSTWIEKAKRQLVEANQKTAELGLEGVMTRSPVGAPETWQNPPPPGYRPGTFRANWKVAIGSPDLTWLDVQDPSGAGTFAEGMLTIERMKAGDIVFITNSVPYARRLEYGWSPQAPAGMVRVTIAALPAELQRVAATIR